MGLNMKFKKVLAGIAGLCLAGGMIYYLLGAGGINHSESSNQQVVGAPIGSKQIIQRVEEVFPVKEKDELLCGGGTDSYYQNTISVKGCATLPDSKFNATLEYLDLSLSGNDNHIYSYGTKVHSLLSPIALSNEQNFSDNEQNNLTGLLDSIINKIDTRNNDSKSKRKNTSKDNPSNILIITTLVDNRPFIEGTSYFSSKIVELQKKGSYYCSLISILSEFKGDCFSIQKSKRSQPTRIKYSGKRPFYILCFSKNKDFCKNLYLDLSHLENLKGSVNYYEISKKPEVMAIDQSRVSPSENIIINYQYVKEGILSVKFVSQEEASIELPVDLAVGDISVEGINYQSKELISKNNLTTDIRGRKLILHILPVEQEAYRVSVFEDYPGWVKDQSITTDTSSKDFSRTLYLLENLYLIRKQDMNKAKYAQKIFYIVIN